MLTKKKKITKNDLINLLIAFIPLSLIIGNLATNINVFLICILGIVIYRFEVFKINRTTLQYLIYVFFVYLIVITLYNNLPNLGENKLYKEHIVKSFLFLRYLILFLVVNKLVEKDHFNINLFFISCGFFAVAVGVDIIIQVTFGENIFGNGISKGRPSSFFGNEHIAGNFLQKFSIFFIVLVISYMQQNKIYFFSILLFVLFFIPIYLTGNRMPTLLYFLSIIGFFILTKQIKKIFLFVFLCTAIVFALKKYPIIDRLNTQTNIFFEETLKFVKKAPKLFYDNTYDGKEMLDMGTSGYLVHFNSGVQLWKENKIFGKGLKSFRLNCTYGNNQTCNTHPHNYIIELLLDVGIVGFTLIYLIFIFSVFNFFNFYKHNSNLKLLSLPFFLIVILEFFPLRSSGSFFTTSNATVIFFMLAVVVGLSSSKKNR